MSLSVNVQGGTRAGRRKIKELPGWECDCPGEVVTHGLTLARVHPGRHYSCPDCGARRDETGC